MPKDLTEEEKKIYEQNLQVHNTSLI